MQVEKLQVENAKLLQLHQVSVQQLQTTKEELEYYSLKADEAQTDMKVWQARAAKAEAENSSLKASDNQLAASGLEIQLKQARAEIVKLKSAQAAGGGSAKVNWSS